MPEGHGLVAALLAALPEGIALALEDPTAGAFGLLPGETLDNAVPKRLAEFAAGRRAARAAIAKLGIPPTAIPHGVDRAPHWPKGVVGSISHTARMCLAMVGRSNDWSGLGVDLEADHPLDAALWPEILRPEEFERIRTMPYAEQGSAAMAVFVAKEAVYKAQYPTSLTLLDFHGLEIAWRRDRFEAKLTRDVPGYAKDTVIEGQLCRRDGYMAAFCAIRRALGA